MARRSFLISFVLAFVLAIGVSSVAFADEGLTTSSKDANASSEISTQASLEIRDFNNHDPRNTALPLNAGWFQVRVIGASSDQITWSSSDENVIRVRPGKEGSLANNSECALVPWGPGQAMITVSCGGDSLTFRIIVQDKIDIFISDRDYTATASTGSHVYNGNGQKISMNISGNTYRYNATEGIVQTGTTVQLKEGTDYQITYKNNINAGTATATVRGIGIYTGSKDYTFQISPASISNASVSAIGDLAYDGNAKRPSVTVKVGGKTLSSSDYSLSYQNNVNPGTATVTISGKGNYTGTVKKTFKIYTTPSTKTPAVSGTWKKQGGRWWYSYSDATKKALNKQYPTSEWLTIGGKKYYFDSAGWMKTGWLQDRGAWYYLKGSGEMATYWQKVNNKWYYLNPSDGKMKTGRFQDSKKTWYICDSSGAMYANRWVKTNNTWYWATGSGALKTGWLKTGGKWYYLDPAKQGAMQTGWLDNNGSRYYLNASGAMLTGWQKLSNKWYYFNNSGAMQRNKWIGNYYVGSDGIMATNTWVGKYHVDANGKWDRTR